MNPIEVGVTLFAAIMLGLLFGKQVSDVVCDKWAFRERDLLSIVRYYYTDNPIRGWISLLIMGFLAVQILVHGITIASLAIFVLASLAPISSYVFPKVHSDVEVSQEIEDDKCNIGRSLAINFLINYLDKILTELPSVLANYEIDVNMKRQLKKSEPMAHDAVPLDEGDFEGPIKVLKKLFVLIPKSGYNSYDNLTTADDKLKSIGTVKINTTNLSGKEREYINTVYQLKQKPFLNSYFLAEFATPLTSIYHVQNLQKKSGKRITSDQVEIFYNSLVELLRRNSKKYGGVCCPILYDDKCDESHPISSTLYEELTKQVYGVPQLSSNKVV